MNRIEINNQLKTIYSVMSIGDYKTALKVAFEMLLQVASIDAETKETEYEKKSLFQVLKLLFDFLVKKDNQYKDIEYLFDDFITLAVYYDCVNRECDSKELSRRIGLLVTKIVGIIEWYIQDKKNGYYTVDSFENTLLDYNKLMFDDASIRKAEALSYYYYIETRYFKIHNNSFWDSTADRCRFIFDSELEWVNYLRSVIESFVEKPEEEMYQQLSNYISSYEPSYFLEKYILSTDNIEYVIRQINGFRETDDVVCKRIYGEINQHKEASFHKHLFSYMARGNTTNEILISELPFSNNRYDIYWHNINLGLSAIIELKVNVLTQIDDNIKQLEDYLTRVNSIIFYKKPQFGILCIYNIGNKDSEYIESKLGESDIIFEKFDDCYYIKNKQYPIVLTIIG